MVFVCSIQSEQSELEPGGVDARIAVDQRLPAPTIGVLREQAQADREKEDGYAWREGEVKRVIEAWQHLKTWQVLIC